MQKFAAETSTKTESTESSLMSCDWLTASPEFITESTKKIKRKSIFCGYSATSIKAAELQQIYNFNLDLKKIPPALFQALIPARRVHISQHMITTVSPDSKETATTFIVSN